MESAESIRKNLEEASRVKSSIPPAHMDKYILRPTRITPLIFFDPNRGLLELRGKSSPENSIQFYDGLLTAVENFARHGNRGLVANFKFEYFNTSSSKCLFDLFRKIIILKNRGQQISINWYYEEDDDDMLEAGEDYSDLLGVAFNFIVTQY